MFVSHCILNENVRYPGGATVPGALGPVVSGYVDRGVGLCQMPCPEQRAWGGVRKRHLLRLYGRRSLRLAPVRRLVLPFATAATAFVYRRLARRVATEIADYVRNGFEVVEVLGVGGSPSCGVTRTLDLDGAVAALACPHGHEDVRVSNRDIVTRNIVEGSGLFIACLDRALRSRGIDVTYGEHDLIAELIDAGAVAR